TSSGNVTLTGLQYPVSPFSVSSVPAFPLTLSPGQTTSVNVAFAPTEISSYEQRISFLTDRGGITVPLWGNGMNPGVLSLDGANPLAFPNTGVGGRSVITVRASNTGDLPLTVTGGSTPAAPFAVAGLPTAPTTLAGGQSIPLQVSFSPSATGTFTS